MAADVPTLGRDGDDGIGPGGQQCPQRVGTVDTAGEAAADSDDGERLTACGRVCVSPMFRLVKNCHFWNSVEFQIAR